MSNKTTQKTLIATSVSAMSAVGFLMVPAHAHADPNPPACAQFGFTGDVQLRQSNGWSVTFSSSGPVASGPATASHPDGLKQQGTISGGINGRTTDLTIRWNNGPKGHYTGVVGNDYHLTGESVDEVNPANRATYRSTFPIGCITPVPPPEQAPAPEQGPAPKPQDPDPVVPAPGRPNDRDSDGLFDDDETNVYGTNPDVADTDGDGPDDGQEVFDGTDPNDPNDP